MSIIDNIIKDKERENNRVYGVVTGIVTNIKDPDNKGRVKVKLLSKVNKNNETDYMRVAVPMAGKDMGMFFMPEVGDEVLVAFDNSNINRPYVIGRLWNDKSKAPAEIKDGKNDIRKIKTKSGHEITFNDEKDKEEINIKTSNALELSLNDKENKIEIKDKKEKNFINIDVENESIKLKCSQKIVIEANGNKIELDGSNGKIKIESTNSIVLKSQQIDIDASAGINIKSASYTNIKSDGPASIKGTIIKMN